MTGKPDNITPVSLEEARAEALALATPEFLAMLDALSDDNIARQVADDPDAAPLLDETWFESARLVQPLKGRKAA